MIVSPARLAANRRNSALSTGPRTPEGKDRSRANALKHGLCATVLVPEDVQLIQQRSSEWYYALKPQNSQQSWLVEQISITSIRIDRSNRMERRSRDRQMLRAELSWDEDRAVEAEELGAKLPRRPSEISRKLKKTPHGCDWMIARWAMLASSASPESPWTPDHLRLAFDLLGTPPELRDAHQPGDVIDLDGRIIQASDGPFALANREIGLLKERREVVAELDEVDRALVATDQSDDPNLELKRIRRYEAKLHTQLRWCMAQILYRSPHAQCNPDFKPRWVERVEEGQEAEPNAPRSIHPPFDLTPEEAPAPGEEADIPKIIANRRDKKIQKAEARREAKRRKVDRLRE